MNSLLRILLIVFIACVGLSGVQQPPAVVENESDDSTEEMLGDDFLFDVVARANESVIGNIDSADLALLAVLAADAAVLVFGIDKIRELSPGYGTSAIILLLASYGFCIFGYLYGLWNARDSIDAEQFFIDFPSDPEGTTATATEGTVLAFRRNIRDRTMKRVFVTISLLLLIAGTVLIALAQTLPTVVPLIHEA